jgi:hypothetical protein
VIVTSTASHRLEEGVERAHALVPWVELVVVTPVVSRGK